jgi:hypothetical protein
MSGISLRVLNAEQSAKSKFTEHLEQASQTVKNFPQWKQNILGDIGRQK